MNVEILGTGKPRTAATINLNDAFKSATKEPILTESIFKSLVMLTLPTNINPEEKSLVIKNINYLDMCTILYLKANTTDDKDSIIAVVSLAVHSVYPDIVDTDTFANALRNNLKNYYLY